MQDKITRSAQINPFSKETMKLQKELIRSFPARAIAFRTVITNSGGRTPGDDKVVFKKYDFPQVIETLSNLRNYKCGRIKRV
jgi:hypothetical protein